MAARLVLKVSISFFQILYDLYAKKTIVKYGTANRTLREILQQHHESVTCEDIQRQCSLITLKQCNTSI